MHKLFFSLVFALVFSCLFAQDAKQLLQQSNAKSKTIQNGYFEMVKSMKFMDEKDTNSFNTFKFYFQKLSNDSIYPSAFHYEHYYNGQYIRNVIYTGKDHVTFSKKDSTGQIMSKPRWAKALMTRRYNDLFNTYAPFTGALYSPYPKDADYADNKIIFTLVAEDTQNNFPCFHVQMITFPKYDSTEVHHNIETKYDYWIHKEDSILVKYSASSKVTKGRDTLQEYLSWSVINYELNNLKGNNLKQLQLSSIPSYCNLVDYTDTETEKVELLKAGAFAPNWTLMSLNDENVRLSDYKGQLVLIDFFYVSCYPCMQALPALKALHEKYKSKGLKVIGINPFDREGDGVKMALSKRGVTYPVFLDTGDVAKNYLVSSYPTMYLIDKNGKIIFSSVGFREELEERLEKLIKQHM